MSAQYYEGIGRRKSSSARVRLFPGGTGRFIINGKTAEDYMPRLGDMEICHRATDENRPGTQL